MRKLNGFQILFSPLSHDTTENKNDVGKYDPGNGKSIPQWVILKF
ncbi:MAG: hypothetical protein ACXWV6_08505 [Chitinophagaceae bacterium]